MFYKGEASAPPYKLAGPCCAARNIIGLHCMLIVCYAVLRCTVLCVSYCVIGLYCVIAYHSVLYHVLFFKYGLHIYT